MTELADLEASLTLFVEGVAGQYLHVKPDTQFAGQTSLSEFAAQSVDAIYLPEQLPQGTRADYRVLAMQQISMRLYGTFDFRLAQFLTLCASPGDQVPSDTALRMGELQRLRQRYRWPGLFQTLFENAERLRLDYRTLRDFPGLGKHFVSYYDATSLGSVATIDPLQQLLGEWREPHRAMLECPSEHCTDPILQVLYDNQASVYDSAVLADELYKRLLENYDPAIITQGLALVTEEGVETSADWLEREARLIDWEEEQASAQTQMMNVLLLDPHDVDVAAVDGLDGDIRPDDANLSSIAQQEAVAPDPEQLQRRLDMERAALRHALGEDRSLARSYRYDEWHYLDNRYLRSWCRLFEEPLAPDPELDGTDLGQRVRQWRDEIRRRLSLIKPLGYLRLRGVEDGDELDFNAVLDNRLDAAAGLTPSERVYSRRDRVQRDLCAAFLIDLSASTDDPMEPPEPAPEQPETGADVNLRDPFEVDFDPVSLSADKADTRRIIDVQREAMLAMSAALESLGDEYGIYGFSGYGKDCVEYYVAKEIGQSFTAKTLHSIAAMKPRRSTRMGPAIRHTTRKLLASGHAMKLMIMLSDGFPQDSDYGPTRGEHEYGVQDTAKALEEAERAGIRTFCITVDRSGHDYLARMCPSDQYLIIEEVDELPAALGKVYERLAT